MIQNFCNEVFFRFRKYWLPKSLRRYRESLETPLEQDQIPAELAEQMSERALRLNLSYLRILKQIPLPSDLEELRVIDIGSKDFVYAPALALFLAERSKHFSLIGLELDPYPVYLSLHRRWDAGRYYANVAQNYFNGRGEVSYRSGDWLSEISKGDGTLSNPRKSFDLVTHFFPFLYEDLHSGAGLPIDSFDPRKSYRATLENSRYGLFFHQGLGEFEDSKKLLKEMPEHRLIFDGIFDRDPWVQRKHRIGVLLVESSSGHGEFF